jgi:hypothetical protein
MEEKQIWRWRNLTKIAARNGTEMGLHKVAQQPQPYSDESPKRLFE